MKLIIDISDNVYEWVMNTGKFGNYRFDTAKAIKNGTPLDDIKDEISKAYHDLPRYYPFALNTFAIIVDEILDSIGKAESEDKNELS